MTLERFKTLYRNLAVITLNTVVLILVINIFLFAFFSVKDRYATARTDNTEQRFELLKKVYPDLSKTEVQTLRAEMESRTLMYDPFTEFKERPYSGKYLHVDVSGFRPVENQGPWPPNKEKYLTVFVFGGSTTFGYGVPDDQTIASYLQKYFTDANWNREVRVYNFGCESYYSTQELILFEQLIKAGFTPDMAVFIDGLNDFWFYDDRPLFSDRFEMLFDGKLEPRPLSRLLNGIPMVRAGQSIRKTVGGLLRRTELKPTLPDDDDMYRNRDVLMKVIKRYVRNKEMIEGLASAIKTRTIFVWQPISTYKYDQKYHLFAGDSVGERAYANYGYPLMAEFVQHNSLGDNFLWCADIQQQTTEPLYVDTMHYTEKMSKLIAKYIFHVIATEKSLSPRPANQRS
jgi:lysophospholipase L1-like esterase